MIRTRSTKKPFLLPVFVSNKLMDLVLPNDNVEIVIVDFGASTYPGIGDKEQTTFPLPERQDILHFLTLWKTTFERLKWKELYEGCEELVLVFKQSKNFPNFGRILDTAFLKDSFQVLMPSKKKSMTLYIPPPDLDRFKQTKTILSNWFRNIESGLDQIITGKNVWIEDDVDVYAKKTMHYLKLKATLWSLMNANTGINELAKRLPITYQEYESLIQTFSVWNLNDFVGANLQEIIETFGNVKENEILLSFAIKNNIIYF